MNYQSHYDALVSRAKSRTLTTEEYTERHHIIPRCMGGNDHMDNLVELLPEEHLIAHLLLVKIHPENNKLVYAAHGMRNGFNNVNRVNNKKYAWLKKRHAKMIGENSKNMVNAINIITGTSGQYSKGEFDSNDDLIGVTNGNVNVFDKELGYYVSVDKDHYHKNKDRYLTSGAGKTLVWNKITNEKEHIEVASIDDEIHVKYVSCFNMDTGESELERQDVFRDSDHLVGNGTGMVPVVDSRDGKTKRVSLDEFYSNKEFYQHKSKGNVSVIVKSTGKTKQVSKEEFYKNRDLYYTTNEKFKTVYDTRTMTKVRIPTEDFKKYDYYVSNQSKKFNIYNSNGELMFETFGNFNKVCDDNGLPKNALQRSRNNGEPIYLNVGPSNEKNLKKKGLLKFKGWYVRREK